MADDPIEAEELERVADWRVRKLGEDPTDAQSADAAKLLQKIGGRFARTARFAALHEYLAILNWLGEFGVTDDFGERANEYRSRIGVEHFPENGEAYLRALIAIARKVSGT